MNVGGFDAIDVELAFGVVIAACIALGALLTYVVEEVRHDPHRHDDDDPRRRE